MAVIKIKEIWNRDAGFDEKGVFTASRGWRVWTDSQADGQLTVLFDAAVLAEIALGAKYKDKNGTEYAGARAQRIAANNDRKHPRVWIVEGEYTSDWRVELASVGSLGNPSGGGGGGTGGSSAADPLGRGYEISWDMSQEKRNRPEGIRVDPATLEPISGELEAAKNSAGDPYDGGLEDDEPVQVLTVSRNEGVLEFDPIVTLRPFVGAVNRSTWAGNPRYAAKILGISAQLRLENGVEHWRVTYRIGIKEDLWLIRKLDEGFRINLGPLVSLVEFRDPRTGAAPSRPILLNGSGLALPKGDPEVYRVYLPRRLADFDQLGIGS